MTKQYPKKIVQAVVSTRPKATVTIAQIERTGVLAGRTAVETIVVWLRMLLFCKVRERH